MKSASLERLRRLFRIGRFRGDVQRDLDEEIAFHLDRTADHFERQGLSPTEARLEAEDRFGDLELHRRNLERIDQGRVRMEARAEWGSILAQDLAYALRGMSRRPGFALAVVLTLALGIGANVTMFGILDRLLLQPPAHVQDAERVWRLWVERGIGSQRKFTTQTVAYPDFTDFSETRSFSHVAGFTNRTLTLGRGPEADRIETVIATHQFFDMLGVRPLRGRFFTAEEDRLGAQGVVVLGYELWRDAFGENPDVVGRTLVIAGAEHTVIGVAPEGFTGLDLRRVDAWLPLHPTHELTSGSTRLFTTRGLYWMRMAARLNEGVSVAAAEEEATRIHRLARRDESDRGVYDAEARIVPMPLMLARSGEASTESMVARWLAGVSLIVLLIACANVANLLLARGTQRRREVAVRLALGVSKTRLVRQHATESMTLALLGGLAGAALARWGGDAVKSVLLPEVLWAGGSGGRILLFTLVASALAGLLAGAGPALQAGTTDLVANLKNGGVDGPGRGRVRPFLYVLQSAMSVVLLVGAGLFVRSLTEIRNVDLGVDADRLLSVEVEFERSDIEGADKTRLFRQVLEEVQRLRGVEAAAVTTSPFMWSFTGDLSIPGMDSIPVLPTGGPYIHYVTGAYLKTMGLGVLAGDPLPASFGEGSPPVAVVNETMARTIWTDGSAVGQCLILGGDTQPCTTVVGVVENAHRAEIIEDPAMQYYVPLVHAPEWWGANGIFVRAVGDPASLVARLTVAARASGSEIRYATVQPLTDILDPQARSWTLGAAMFTIFGLLALVVASIGLYAVLAFDVAQRTREIGIRTALGAHRTNVLRMILGEGLRLSLLGIVLGGTVAAVAATALGDLLFGVSPRDPTVLVTVALTLLSVGLLASLLPALRATRIDPNTALRVE